MINREDSDIIGGWLTGRARSSIAKYKPCAVSWARFLAERGKNLKKATDLDASAWVAQQTNLKGIGCRLGLEHVQISRYTLALKSRMLSSLHTYMMDFGYTQRNIWLPILRAMAKARGGDRRPTELIPFDKVPALLEAPSGLGWEAKRDRAFLALLLGCGMRIGEVLNLSLGDFNCNGNAYLTLRDTKSGGTQRQVLPDWVANKVSVLVAAMLDFDLKGEGKSFPLFQSAQLTKDGLEWKPRARWHKTSASKAFKRYCRQVGLDVNISCHSARATVATYLLSQGMSYREVQEVLRHSSTAMVERYDKRRYALEDSPSKKVSWDLKTTLVKKNEQE